MQSREGDDRAFDGLIGELIVWNYEISSAEAFRASVYLTTKWVLTGEVAQAIAAGFEQLLQGGMQLEAAVPKGAKASEFLVEVPNPQSPA
jgi:hypothetical protein